VINYQLGDVAAAVQSLRRSTDLETKRQRRVNAAARATRDELLRRMEITEKDAAEMP
jgi:hypothetical protein